MMKVENSDKYILNKYKTKSSQIAVLLSGKIERLWKNIIRNKDDYSIKKYYNKNI